MERGAGSYFIDFLEEYSFQNNPHLDPGGLRTPLGRHYERPARSWLTSGRDQKWSDETRGPRTEIAEVECREARRLWTGDLRRNGDRPDREAGHEVRRTPHQRRLGAPPPSRL